MRNPKIEFDNLQMYFGEPYVIDLEGVSGSITVYQPTIGDIIAIGEKTFYSTLNVFTTNTTSHKLELWENGIDWNEMSDFELFCMYKVLINPKVSYLMFKDLDFSKFEIFQKTVDDKVCLVLYNEEEDIEINEMVYHHISQYLRNVFNTFPEEKITNDNIMKKWFIDKEKRQLTRDKEKLDKGEIDSYSIQPVVSACVNHPGFKYKLHELKELGVCAFYDSVKRLQVYENTTALMKGMYSGMIDAKSINADDYNFMKKI